jgi:hypothetical protein
MSLAIPTMFFLALLLGAPIVAGIVLIIVSRRRATPFPQCGKCGYNVSASIGTTTRCPECGGEFGVVGIKPTIVRGNPATLWLGIAMVALPMMCVGTGLAYSLAARSAAQARAAAQAAAAANAARATAQATQQQSAAPPQPSAAINEITTLTAEDIANMTQAEVRAWLANHQHDRAPRTPEDQERLKREFGLILDRLRELQEQERPRS